MIELGEGPKKFTMRVDRVARELRRGGKPVDEDKNLAILSGLTQGYAVERRMLEGGDDEPTRAHIEKGILNQYERLLAGRSEAGAKASRQRRNTTRPSPLPRSLNEGSSPQSLMASAPGAGGGSTAARSAVGARIKKVRRLLHLRQSGAQGYQLPEAMKRGERERMRVADDSHYGGNGFPKHHLREL